MQCGSIVLDGTGHGTLYIGGAEKAGPENAGLKNKLERDELRLKQMIRHTGWPKKPQTILLSISLLNMDRFS